MNWEPCVSCARLSKCGDTDSVRISAGEGCSLHEIVHEGVFRARLRIMDEFGAVALPTKQNTKDGVIVMSAEIPVKKVTLRALGYRLGVLQRNTQSFQLKEEELFNLLAPKYPKIREMSNEEVENIIQSIGDAPDGGKPAEEPAKPAAAPPAKAPKAKVVEPAPEEEVEEGQIEEEEEAPKAPAKRGPAARKPAAAPAQAPAAAAPPKDEPAGRKPPVRPAAPPAPRVSSEPVSGNTGRLEEMLTVIGTAGDARDEKIAALTAQVTKLTKILAGLDEKVTAIDGYLTYQYNGTVGPDDAIKTLSDIDPWVDPS
jgi:hypothetical protein